MKSSAIIFLSLITLAGCVFVDQEDSICTNDANKNCINQQKYSVLADKNMIKDERKNLKRCDEARRYCTKFRQSGTDYNFPPWEGGNMYEKIIPNPCFWILTYCHGISIDDFMEFVYPLDPYEI